MGSTMKSAIVGHLIVELLTYIIKISLCDALPRQNMPSVCGGSDVLTSRVIKSWMGPTTLGF